MGLTTYVMLLFGISVAMFLLGSKPMLFAMMQCNTSATTCDPGTGAGANLVNNLLAAIQQNLVGFGVAGLAFLAAGALLGGSFVVMFLVPLAIIVSIDFLLIPTDFIFSSALPIEVRLIIFGFMNVLLVLTIVGFVRGYD